MQTRRQVVDYALQRKALLAKVYAGLTPTTDVCDANPYLLQAAKFHGTQSEQSCPVCRKERLKLVRWVYGDSLGQAAGSARAPEELTTMAARYPDFRVYVVEVCRSCHWNHLVQSYVLGTGELNTRRQGRRTAGQ